MMAHYTSLETGRKMNRIPTRLAWQRAVPRSVTGFSYLLALLVAGTQVRAQNTSSDLCGFLAANQHTVNTTCVPSSFVKPSTYVGTVFSTNCNGTVNDDAFGWFVATSTSTIITYTPPGVTNPILHVFSGTCAAPVELACTDVGGNGVAETLTLVTTIGTTYFFRIQRNSSNNVMDGTVCVYSPTPPANDNPCTATPLTIGTTCTFGATTNSGATSSPGLPAVSCSNYLGGDVWFSAVVPASGRLVFDTNTGVITDGGMALYTATACNGTFTEIECDDDDSGNGLMPFIDRSGLTPGATVYLRFWEYGNDNNGAFSLCAYSPPPPAASCGTTVYDPGGAAGNYANNATFTATYCPAVAGQVVTLTFTAFGTEAFWDVLNVYNGPSTAYPLLNSYSGAALPGAVTSSAIGGCLTVQFTSDNTNVGLGWAANVTCAAPPAAPANNDPCGATLLTVGTSCTFVGSTTANSTATVGPPAPTCANYIGSDVWFRAVVPASGSLILETSPNVVTDGGMALYTATSCAGPFFQQACDDDGGPGLMPLLNMTGLAPGSTVYIRFWEFGGNNNGTFSICARTPPPPPTGDCVYALNLFDAFGDGWGTSNVGVRINGGPFTYYTVGGSTNQVLLGMNIGDFIELFYDNTGAYQGENSFTLGLMSGGTYFNSGSPPLAGNSFSQIVDCAAPPTAPQDCNGGFTICGAQSFTNNSGNSGNVVDLNTANQGCLSLGERQGTWYYFSPSASGTVGLDINPATDVDYDFAIWGPPSMGTITCPPNASPIRCSWASGGSTFTQTGNYNTGLRPEADVTEGAGGNGWVNLLTVVAGQQYILYVDNFQTSNEPFELTWQLSGGASLDCTVLPVELVNLKAEAMDQNVDLSWNTLSESNSDRFVIERSTDDITFERIGGLNALGNSTHLTDYRFTDQRPHLGVNFYRVTLVDLDGTEVRSPVVQASIAPHGNQPIIVPNPAKELAYITLKEGLDSGVEIRLTDAAGRLVRSVFLAVPEGTTRVELPLVGVDAGIYSVGIIRKDGSAIGYTNFIKE